MSDDTASEQSAASDTTRRPGPVNSDLWSALALFAIGGVALVGLYGRTGDSWIFPRVITYTMLVLGLALLVKAFLRPERLQIWASSQITREVWIFIGGVSVYVLALRFVGFWVASALTCFVLIYLLGPERTSRRALMAFVVSAGTLAFLFLVFRQGFNVPLPESTWF